MYGGYGDDWEEGGEWGEQYEDFPMVLESCVTELVCRHGLVPAKPVIPTQLDVRFRERDREREAEIGRERGRERQRNGIQVERRRESDSNIDGSIPLFLALPSTLPSLYIYMCVPGLTSGAGADHVFLS